MVVRNVENLSLMPQNAYKLTESLPNCYTNFLFLPPFFLGVDFRFLFFCDLLCVAPPKLVTSSPKVPGQTKKKTAKLKSIHSVGLLSNENDKRQGSSVICLYV